MIKYNPKSWIKLIFALHKSDTLRMLWKEIIYISLLAFVIAYVEMTYLTEHRWLTNLNTVYSLVGFVISLLLVFRTNTAYDRWWEGRKQWGGLINDSRNLAVKLNILNLEMEDKEFFKRMVANFAFATRDHLINGADMKKLNLTEYEKMRIAEVNHIPVGIVELMYEQIGDLRKRNVISPEDYLTIDKNLNAFIAMVGACERIKNTPIPFSYSLFIKKFIFFYTATLPVAFVGILGYFSVLVTAFVFYVLVSMEVLAEEIEEPFGTDDNDLPTDEIAQRIQENVCNILR